MEEFIERMSNNLPQIVKATGVTLMLSSAAVLVGILLGLFLALGRMSKIKPLKGICWFYIWVFRGTPMLMQIFFIYFTLPQLVKFIKIEEYSAAIIALGLNSAAYLAEIIRAALQSIDKGQLEASKALGMSYGLAMRRIIIPQSIRRMLPPVGNEFIMLIKDTSLVSAISLTELLKVARGLVSSTGDAIYYLPIAAIYLFLTSIFTWVFEKIEKKYSVYE